MSIINKAWKQVRDFEDVFGLAPGQILFKDEFKRRYDEETGRFSEEVYFH